MGKQETKILISITKSTKVLGVIPQLFCVSLICPFLAGLLAHFFDQPPLFWSLFCLISSYGTSLYVTYIDEDFLKIKKAQNHFRKTKNYISTKQQKYMP